MVWIFCAPFPEEELTLNEKVWWPKSLQQIQWKGLVAKTAAKQ